MTSPGTAPARVWGDYLFLTREIGKFLARQDFAMATELLDQRDRLQSMIEAMPPTGFLATQEGQEIRVAIEQENKAILNKIQLLLNKARQDQTVSQAYDLYGAAQRLGSRMDRSR